MYINRYLFLFHFLYINALAVINGSMHDLSYLKFTVKEDDGILCIYCHTPHGSNSNFSGNTVWDNDLSINETTYLVYDKNIEGEELSTNPSKACLSCHDGVNAVNTMFEFSSGLKNINSSQESMHEQDFFDGGHPISIDYDDSKASLNPINSSFGSETKGYSAVWHTPDGSQSILSVLRNNRIECSSCHDPHLGENATFLRVKSNGKSLLCLGCHGK